MTDERKWVGSCDQGGLLVLDGGVEISSREKLGQRWPGKATAAAQGPCQVTWVQKAQNQQVKLKATFLSHLTFRLTQQVGK